MAEGKGTAMSAWDESAGASLLRDDGAAWTTDKDGLIIDMLAADIPARTGKDLVPGVDSGAGRVLVHARRCPANPEEKARLQRLSPAAVRESRRAAEPITAKLTRAPENDAPIDGLKVMAASGWFAARPSGTENLKDLRRELPGPGSPGRPGRRGPGDREQCPGRLLIRAETFQRPPLTVAAAPGDGGSRQRRGPLEEPPGKRP